MRRMAPLSSLAAGFRMRVAPRWQARGVQRIHALSLVVLTLVVVSAAIVGHWRGDSAGVHLRVTITETLSAGGPGGGGGDSAGSSSSSSWNTENGAAQVSWMPQQQEQQLDGGPPAEWLGNEEPAEGEESEESDEAFIARLMAAEREEERLLLQRLHRQQQQGFEEEGQEAGLNIGDGDGSSAPGGGKAGRRRQEPPPPPVPLASRLRVFSTPDWAGKPKHYYSFRDVQLGQGQLRYFAPEGLSQPDPLWVDIAEGNTSSSAAPTMLILRGEDRKKGSKPRYYLPVNYSAGSTARCMGWEERPMYLLQVRYSHNIWHTMNEGIMAAFQTLREQGALPLVEVDAGSRMREVTEGVAPDCPRAFDPFANASAVESSCQSRPGSTPPGLESGTCDAKNQWWCRPGMRNIDRSGGPLILVYTARSLRNRWPHFYWSMTDEVRMAGEREGWCFRNLIAGHSTTMDFYHVFNSPSTKAAQAQRVEAASVFKAFLRTAQEEKVQQEPWLGNFRGYPDGNLELLRRGIGPESIDLADKILPFKLPAGSVPGPEELHSLWKKHRKSKAPPLKDPPSRPFAAAAGAAAEAEVESEAQLAAEAAEAEELAGPDSEQQAVLPGGDTGAAAPAEAPSLRPKGRLPLESPRPVVTYMSRRGFSRSILNEHELLRYILARYNVTLHVTTLDEPLLEVMELLEHTDVLIGMHGAAWTNGLFVKTGAAAIQLHPYGWRLPSGNAIRGDYYREVVRAQQCPYFEWFNTNPQHAFFRKLDFTQSVKKKYKLSWQGAHPDAQLPAPSDAAPAAPWIYQNTYVDMDSLGTVIDHAMQSVGISRMEQVSAQAHGAGGVQR